jgi:hypothetical protein
MDRPIKAYEFIAGLIAFIFALITSGYNIGSKQGEINQRQAMQDIKISQMEAKVNQIEEALEKYSIKIDEKIDPVRKDLTDIKILLQNKQDRRR